MNEFTITTSQGIFPGYASLLLFYQSWHPVESPKAVVISVHGGGDYAGGLGYQWLARYLAASRYAVYGYDLRGHGRSAGRRLHIDAWRELRADLSAFLHFVRVLEPDLPVFLFGISLGSIIVLDHAIHQPHQMYGVIAASAPVGEMPISPIMAGATRLLSRIAPRLELKMGPDAETESRDAEAVAVHVNDPLKYYGGTVRFFVEMLEVVKQIQSQAGQLNVPLLMLQGSADPVAIPDEAFFQRVACADKQRKVYDGARHNLLIETNREEVFQDIGDWIEAHL